MKNIFLFGIVLIILFTGCSSTYHVQDFRSQQDFYNEINGIFNKTETVVILYNDSLLLAQDGVAIKDQLLVCYTDIVERREQKRPLADLSSLDFNNQRQEFANIKMRTGESFKAENIRVGFDSIQFTEINNIKKISTFSIDSVKSIKYNSRWNAMSTSGKIGIFTLSLLGYYIGKHITQQRGGNSTPAERDSQELEGFIGGFIYGAIIAPFVGLFWDYPVIYEFPSK